MNDIVTYLYFGFGNPILFWRLIIMIKKKNIDKYTLVTRFCTKKGCFNTSECDMIENIKGPSFLLLFKRFVYIL